MTMLAFAWTAVARKRVAAIGPATADALAEHGVRPEIVPSEYRAEALVDRLRHVVAAGDRVLLPRAKETRDVHAALTALISNDLSNFNSMLRGKGLRPIEVKVPPLVF